jgi:hypothetical protein
VNQTITQRKPDVPVVDTPENGEQVTMQLNQSRMHVFFGKKI